MSYKSRKENDYEKQRKRQSIQAGAYSSDGGPVLCGLYILKNSDPDSGRRHHGTAYRKCILCPGSPASGRWLRLIADLSDPDKEVVLARGGNGGWGNAHFATAIRQTPNFAKNGQTGDEREIVLELKLLADVGLVGFPNVGKSTLLSMTTKADPKIANYHFTTLEPNLGVVDLGDHRSFVLADIPGIIEGR